MALQARKYFKRVYGPFAQTEPSSHAEARVHFYLETTYTRAKALNL